MGKFRHLEADEIEVRVSRCSEYGCECLLYKTARTDMDILDEEVGPDNWYCEYQEIKGNLFCGISIKTGNGWITKWDCGIESAQQDGNEKKAESSDAMKRAGFRWGIGRQLYTAPKIKIKPASCNLKKRSYGGRDTYACYDDFSVYDIEYDEEDKRITKLVIKNDTTGGIVFEYSDR